MGTQDYNPSQIEPRWQQYWDEKQVFRVANPGQPGFDASKPKYYVLDMFPYPSGAGLHVGHPEGYTATDIVARYRRMRGHNVLHPMGWDAFGLPAEQYAIQTGTHPDVSTNANIGNFRRQLKALGFSYDWSREISTTDPKYFRWTQWIFSRLFEMGLAYQAEVAVWWCDALGTVLANEEVIHGRSERGDHPCVRRPLKQWMLKITAYAERLLDDLEGLDWPESVKTMQREWIGRSEGAEVDFKLQDHQQKVRVFTTRPDTLFGASFMVLAPELPLVNEITTDEQRATVEAYQIKAAAKSELDRTDLAKEITGVFTGAYALNPVYPADDPRAKVPIWIADYVISTYGTGAIMAVPAGDERDFKFASEFGIPIPPIFKSDSGDQQVDQQVAKAELCWTGEATYINSANEEGLDLAGMSIAQGKRATIDWLAKQGVGEAKVTYRLRDWLFSRQRYWGEPFPILHHADGRVELLPDDALPLTLPDMQEFSPAGKGEPPLAKATQWVQTTNAKGEAVTRELDTMPNWAGSCWYYLRYMDPDNDSELCAKAAEQYWGPVDLYVGGTEHAVLHLLYARFWHKVLADLGVVHTAEPFQKLYNQGMILSFAFQDQRGATIPADLAVADGDGYKHKDTGEPLQKIVAKMSKTLKNVVNPDEVIQDYGADSLRLYEMYMGPLADPKPWNTKDVPGVHRFLKRVWRLLVPAEESAGLLRSHLQADQPADPDLEKTLHRAVHKVGQDIDRMAFNTAIAAMMIFVNEANKAVDKLNRSQAQRLLILLNPFAPHMTEELWSRMGAVGELSYQPWPEVDPAMLQDDAVEYAVQIMGKVRGRVTVAADAAKDLILQEARAQVAEQLSGKKILKEIVVPGRLVNFVAK